MHSSLISLLMLTVLAGCTNSDDDMDGSLAIGLDSVEDVGGLDDLEELDELDGLDDLDVPDDPDDSGQDMQDDNDAEDTAMDSVISLDNHVELLRNVFAIYSGKAYGDDLLTAPDYSDPAFDGGPELDGDGNPVSPPVELVCANGGEASFVPESDGLPIDNVVVWNFEFDACQDGATILDGELRREIYESILITSPGFTSTAQALAKQFSGSLFHTAISASYGSVANDGVEPYAFDRQYLDTEELEFSRVRPTDSLEITRATTLLSTSDDSGLMRGGFVVQADWTDDKPITVLISESFTYSRESGIGPRPIQFEEGRLFVSDTSGARMVVRANTGDVDTVQITIASGNDVDTFVTQWTPWVESLSFESESGF